MSLVYDRDGRIGETGLGWISYKLGMAGDNEAYLLLVTCVECASNGLRHHSGGWKTWVDLIREPTPFVMPFTDDIGFTQWFVTVWSLSPCQAHPASHAGSKRP